MRDWPDVGRDLLVQPLVGTVQVVLLSALLLAAGYLIAAVVSLLF